MTERSGIFAGDDPFEIAKRWLSEAEGAEPRDPNAAALATVDGAGLPNVRMVLVKEIEAAGGGRGAFVFYTNYGSAKGLEISSSGKAALVMHWKSLGRQVRVRGGVEREDGAKADGYYASRPLPSRVGAWASKQSRPLESREFLLAEAAAVGLRLGTDPGRPPFWGGFRVVPVEMEFWAEGAFRLHDRFRWTRGAREASWGVERLHP